MRRKTGASIGVLAAVYFLMGSAVCISISVQSDIGGFNQDIGADSGDSVFSHTVISREALSTQISSSGNFRDRHSIADGMGQKAEIGVDIKKAQSYDYGYTLDNGDGNAIADETLNVINAVGIEAYASAINAYGDESGVSISISDRWGMANLDGYSNYAEAKSEASDAHSSVARQQFASASGNNILIDEKSSQADRNTASASMKVFDGYVESYFGDATASKGMHKEVYELDGSVYSMESWDKAEASHQANIIQGERIDIAESASQDYGDRAFTSAGIEGGNTAGYEGRAHAGISSYLTHGYYGYSFEEISNYSEASHSISSIHGRKLALLEGAITNGGDSAIMSLISEGAAEMYDGSSSAMIDDSIVDYGNGFVAELHSDDAESTHRATINDRKALIQNGARSAEGDASLIATDAHLLPLSFDGFAFGGDRSSIIHNPDGSNTVWVGDGSTASEMYDPHNPVYNLEDAFIDVRALAISSEWVAQYQSDKINAEEMGELTPINVIAQVYEGNPETHIFAF
jgi:hypothetical protein